MKFKLIHNETGLTLGQYNAKYGVKYYDYSGHLILTTEFQNNCRLKPFIMGDGVIGFEKIGYLDYYEYPYYQLDRKEWHVEFK